MDDLLQVSDLDHTLIDMGMKEETWAKELASSSTLWARL